MQLAKALATIDRLAAAHDRRYRHPLGHRRAQATGATRADRGRVLDETLDVFSAVWGPDPVTFRGPRVVVDNASVLPRPVSKSPVMLGGGGSDLVRSTSSKAVPRIAKRADGSLPLLTTPGPTGAADCAQAGTRPGNGF